MTDAQRRVNLDATRAATPRVAVADLRKDMTVRRQQFLLREKSVTQTRTGSSLLRVILSDRTGSIPAVLFDAPDGLVRTLEPGRGVEVSGRVSEYRDDLQLTIERIVASDIADLGAFLPVARRPIPEMMAEFAALRETVLDPNLRRLMDSVFGEGFSQRFATAPAAKTYHHACVGGLLEHTLCVARLVLDACEQYPELDRDLALTVALLHDVGKVEAYDPLSFDLTDVGVVWGHLYVGAALVQHAIDGLSAFPAEMRLRVVHAVLAHHGRLEYGSPVLPMTLEALVLHNADKLDGDVRGAIDQFDRSQGEPGSLTKHSAMHETRLFRGQP